LTHDSWAAIEPSILSINARDRKESPFRQLLLFLATFEVKQNISSPQQLLAAKCVYPSQKGEVACNKSARAMLLAALAKTGILIHDEPCAKIVGRSKFFICVIFFSYEIFFFFHVKKKQPVYDEDNIYNIIVTQQ
jgi:hypothetical protein